MKKYAFLILIAGLAVLIFFQQKVVMPLVLDVVKSDTFLVDSKEQSSQLPLSTPLTTIAFKHCNTYVKSELDPEITISFADKPLNTWTLGNYHYVVNAEFNVTSSDSKTITKKYVCRIDYKNGDNEEGSMDFDNWSIEGVDGIENISN